VSILPLRTERLLLRVMKPADAATLAAYRGDPAVARFQDWELPFTLEDAERALAGQADLDDLEVDRWVQIAMEHDGVVVGDLAVNLARGGHVPFVGYTLAPEHQGRGYASRRAAAIVDAIFTHTAAHRIVATLDPQNFASMRVIEPLGFEHEGVAREHELVRGEWVDDCRFALLRTSWDVVAHAGPVPRRCCRAARDHARQRAGGAAPADVHLPGADGGADGGVVRRRPDPEVVDGAPVVPWYRAIYAGDVPVGFLMIADGHRRAPRALPVAPAHRPAPPGPRHRACRAPRAGRPAPGGRPPNAPDELGRRPRRPCAVLSRARVRPDGRDGRDRGGGATRAVSEAGTHTPKVGAYVPTS
jgi:RimJ/RimL family protein N-acetyltransferase